MTLLASAVEQARRLDLDAVGGIRDFVRTAYDLPEVRAVRAMGSEHDDTFVLDGVDGPFAVLKVGGASSLANWRMQVLLLDHVSAGAYVPVSSIIPSRDGRALVPTALGPVGAIAMVMTFCPGSALEDIAPSETLVAQVARALARLQQALEDCPADTPADHPWSLDTIDDHAHLVERHLGGDEREQARAILARFADFRATVRPRWETQLLHADFNLSNVLTDGERVTGVIDFGDAVRAPRIYDVAIALAYLRMQQVDRASEVTEIFLSSYTALAPLDSDALDHLPLLVGVRTLMVLLLGRESASTQPDRAEYALRYDALAVEAFGLLRLSTRDVTWGRSP